mmetsp:Transcript_7668/g.10005  ORF Transcript_7668/g.10005 Transcript_7668/m.10005 type:complete len:399 (+) Transcript_7668:143-1339(+)
MEKTRQCFKLFFAAFVVYCSVENSTWRAEGYIQPNLPQKCLAKSRTDLSSKVLVTHQENTSSKLKPKQKLPEIRLENEEFQEFAFSNKDLTALSSADNTKLGNMLNHAYEECERITRIYAKTFYLGTRFMPIEKKKAVWAIYVWCRRTDDLVDGPRALMHPERMESDLEAWEKRLEDIWAGKPHDPLDLALWDCKRRYPDLDIQPFKDMIDGMRMDIPVPGVGVETFENFEELELYCYRVAGTVGLMTLPIMGLAPGSTVEDAMEPALSLGIALQLTNIIRDVGEDTQRDRIYLPKEDLRRFKVSESHIMRGFLSDNYVEMLKFQIERARYYYQKAESGIQHLDPAARFPVRASLDIYSQILDKVEENEYDNFKKRAYVSKFEKIFALPGSFLKAQQR